MADNRECSPPRPSGAHEIPILVHEGNEDKPLYPLTLPSPAGPGLNFSSGSSSTRSSRTSKTPTKYDDFTIENEQPSSATKKYANSATTGRWWSKRQEKTAVFRPNEDSHYNLPDGWKKLVTTRKSGATAGTFDVYLCPPGHKKLRSNNDVIKFVHQNPNFPLDPAFVNMEPPLSPSGRTEETRNVLKLKELVTQVRQTGEIPEKISLASSGKKAPKPKTYARKGTTQINTPSKFGSAKAPRSLGKSKASWSNFTKDKIMKLERLFVSHCEVPSPFQVQVWSTNLQLKPDDVMRWFKQKWESKLEYEAAEAAAAAISRMNAESKEVTEKSIDEMLEPEVIIRDEVVGEGEEILELDEDGKLISNYQVGGTTDLLRTRKPVKFDVDTCGETDPPVDDEYVIEYDAQEDDEVEAWADVPCEPDEDVIEIVEDDLQFSDDP